MLHNNLLLFEGKVTAIDPAETIVPANGTLYLNNRSQLFALAVK